MKEVFGAKYVTLHVRETNRAAIGLYRDALGFMPGGVEKGYCKSTPSKFGAPQVRASDPWTGHPALTLVQHSGSTPCRSRACWSLMANNHADVHFATDADGEDAYAMRLDF